MSDKLKHIDVPLEFTIPGEGSTLPVLTALRITRPKTRHIITLTALFGPDLAAFIASSDGDDAKAKLAALQEDAEGLGQLITSLVKIETLDALLKVIADLCGINAGETPAIGTPTARPDRDTAGRNALNAELQGITTAAREIENAGGNAGQKLGSEANQLLKGSAAAIGGEIGRAAAEEIKKAALSITINNRGGGGSSSGGALHDGVD